MHSILANNIRYDLNVLIIPDIVCARFLLKGMVMRLSSIQKTVLFVLFAIEQRMGQQTYVESPALNSMINNNRDHAVLPNNFRVSCHKLKNNGLLVSERAENLVIKFALSDAGRLIAKKLCIEKEIEWQKEHHVA